MTNPDRWRPLLLALLVAACAPLCSATPAPDQSDYAALMARVEAHRLLLIGEIHGTAQVPAIVASLATRMAALERPLIVGLELPRTLQPALKRFLASAGTQEDRKKLLAEDFWQRDYQDGRSSVAMLELLESLRALDIKRDLEVLAFDVPADTKLSGAERDQRMAERIAAALEAKPLARAIVLAGNFHTRIQAEAPWDPKHQFMGYRLETFDPYAIEIIGIQGSAWICTGADVDSCKARETPANTLEPGLELGDTINERGHHAIWRLPISEMSPPAKDRE
jgi:hypothetical protein